VPRRTQFNATHSKVLRFQRWHSTQPPTSRKTGPAFDWLVFAHRGGPLPSPRAVGFPRGQFPSNPVENALSAVSQLQHLAQIEHLFDIGQQDEFHPAVSGTRRVVRVGGHEVSFTVPSGVKPVRIQSPPAAFCILG
jgi:hypothetical protein